MPECKLGLNDRILLEAQGRTGKGKAIDLEDIKFHQYVSPLSDLLYCIGGSMVGCNHCYKLTTGDSNELCWHICNNIPMSDLGVCVSPDLKMTGQYPSYRLMEHLIL